MQSGATFFLLNPDWLNRIIKIDDDATICATVVFKGEVV